MGYSLAIGALLALVLVVQLATVLWLRRKFAAFASRAGSAGASAGTKGFSGNLNAAVPGNMKEMGKSIARIETALNKQHLGLQNIYADVAYLTYSHKLETQLGDATPEQARYWSDQLENTLVKKYYWGREKVEQFPLIDLLSKHAKIKGRQVLCVGARNEDEINYFKGKDAASAIGIDLFSDSDQILVMDMHKMLFEDDSFDIVYARHSFEHSKDPYVVASELMRVCRDGGVIMVEVPGNYKGGGDYSVFTDEKDLLRYFESGVGEVKHLSMSKKEDNKKKMDILRMMISVEKKVLPVRPFPVYEEFTAQADNKARKTYAQSINNDEAFDRVNERLKAAAKEVPLPDLGSAGKRVVADLKNDGIALAHIDEFLPETALTELQDRYELQLKLFQMAHPNPGGGKGKTVFLDTLRKGHKFRNDDVLSDILVGREISGIGAHYMGMVPRFVGASVWHNRVVPPESARLFSQRWHRDYNDQLIMKIFIYLNDVDEGTGPFEYLKGSHKFGRFGNTANVIGDDGYREYPGDDVVNGILAEAGDDARLKCMGRAGTMVFADTFGLHRGGYCSAKARNMIMGTYSTDANFHRPHFEVSADYRGAEDPFLRVVLGLDEKPIDVKADGPKRAALAGVA